MATFRVGQRVRLVKHNLVIPTFFRLPIGTEGVIVPNPGLPYRSTEIIPEYKVCWRNDLFLQRGAESWQLEPLYDGNTTVSWESCEWQPNKAEA